MTTTTLRRLLFSIAVAAGLPLSGCARSAIEDVEEEDSAVDVSEAGADGDATTEDAGTEPDAEVDPTLDGGEEEDASEEPDTGETDPSDGGEQEDAGDEPDAGNPDAGEMSDGGPSDAGGIDAGPDAAADAAADAGPTCREGTYRGSFMGKASVAFIIPLFDIPFTGEISLVLAPDTGGKYPVRDGRITGQDDQGNPLEARVTGTLNCVTGNLENGKLADGIYRGLSDVTFTGNVTGTYRHNPPGASGAWETENASTQLLRDGEGTWNVSLVQ